jgi:glycogen phosphorylase
MKPSLTFVAVPTLPKELENLRKIAYNLHWAWDHDAIELFRRLDSELWETTGHNPILMLGKINQSALMAAVMDDGFMAHLEQVSRALDEYLANRSTWYQHLSYHNSDALVAYFSAEFGITECLSIFAGGLGILAGDHLKSASDLGIPLVAIGLLYQQGYFKQYLSDTGWQQEKYEDNDFHNLPITLVNTSENQPLSIKVKYAGRDVTAQVWKALVGKITLYLLDTNLATNPPGDRDITDQLYGGDFETRIKQEILLGIGGYHVLEALGIKPTIFHMNEGHSAFLALEHVRRLMETQNLSFIEACEAARPSLVFTTHTAVAAGHDYFSPELMDRYFGDYYRIFGISRRDFLALGRQDADNNSEAFCMTILALKMAVYSNAVSRLHGQVSRKMWQGLWKGVPENEIPIGHVTNGVHLKTWISRDMNQVYERYLGYRWQTESGDQKAWQRVEQIPASELWRTHERRRERMVAFARGRLRFQLERRGALPAEILVANEVLDPEALTIGFARRFATYKRATLLLQNPDRLEKILNRPDCPVQLIFAGKAHPHDDPGKELIRRIVELAHEERFRRKIVFLEDYDMSVARYLVQGADIWLNTPLRLYEASGTSGMKAAVNGVINVSILDGWWDEAHTSEDGWAIGRGESYSDQNHQAQIEAEALYSLLEQEIVPEFYHRGEDGLPYRWIRRMRASIQSLGYYFNTHRMVGQYTEDFYQPASNHSREMIANDFARAKSFAAWKDRVRRNWSSVRVEVGTCCVGTSVGVGEEFKAEARVSMQQLMPEDIQVELCLGQVNSTGQIGDFQVVPMRLQQPEAVDGRYVYASDPMACSESGLYGYTVRVLPCHPDLISPFMPGIITWANPD